jgi:ribonucleotide reductase alpha subunit
MQVVKRNGNKENVCFDKITRRISALCNGLEHVDPIIIAKDVIMSLNDGIKTTDLDVLSADISASKAHHYPDYNKLGGRILSSNLTKSTEYNYKNIVTKLYDHQLISEIFFNFVTEHHLTIQTFFDFSRDLLFDYFAIKTLERSYLMKIDGKILERPQHMWMRVAIQIHGCHIESKLTTQEKLEKIKETYDYMSQLYFTHATPTLFNSGTKRPQLSSCFLYSSEDNIEDIFKTISDTAKISKWAGGIGMSLSNIRAKGSMIRGTNGKSEGIIPLCKTLEMVSRYINQGGKRKGSIAVYLEPFHADIFDFVELRKNTGDENLRARDLFIALWVPDLFMKRVENDEIWSLMCPDECPGLIDVYGEEFEKLYIQYETEKRYKRQVKARELWNHIIDNQIETGMPYISFKDNVNKRNMQSHLGVVRNSNLCVAPETMILTESGYHKIKDLENTDVNIWNGEEFTPTKVLKTGENQELIKIVLSNGSEIECTPYHKFYVDENNKNIQYEAKKLKNGMKLIKTEYPIIREGLDTFSHNKNEVPINYNIKIKLEWLEKNIDDNGKINNSNIELVVDNKDKLQNIKYLLQTLGCDPDIKNNKLCLTSWDVAKLYDLGFRPKRLQISGIYPKKHTKRWIQVTDIIYTNRVSDTYCFKEEKRGMGIFNGIITGQCNEISLVSNKDNYAVCNLSSICLSKFVENGIFNFRKLRDVAEIITQNLNNVIDVNYYPTPETRKTNMENRPIGIGVQGLADVYCMMGLPFGSEEAKKLNKEIFENIYFGSVKKSIELAKEYGPYLSYNNSPHSQNLLQFNFYENVQLSLDWEDLFEDMADYGMRNSLLTALMPTASTSQIMGNNECFEPFTTNIYVRKTLAGEFTVVNQYLIKDLIKLGLWTKEVYEEILYDNGSVQRISCIPQEIKDIYKTAFELKVTDILKQAVDRSPFIDHQQSMNLFMSKVSFQVLHSSHFYSWKNGLKTGMYYLRTQPAVDAIKFGLDANSVNRIKKNRKEKVEQLVKETGTCPMNPELRELCESCSS